MDNAASRKQVREAEKRAKEVEQRRLETTNWIMDTKGGREWVYDLLASCNIFADPFTGEALLEAFNKGQRNVGLRILADIMRSSTEEYVVMMREANERATAAAAAGVGDPASEDGAGDADRSDPAPATGADVYGEEAGGTAR